MNLERRFPAGPKHKSLFRAILHWWMVLPLKIEPHLVLIWLADFVDDREVGDLLLDTLLIDAELLAPQIRNVSALSIHYVYGYGHEIRINSNDIALYGFGLSGAASRCP
jgi:hypothetical protein